MKKAMKLVLTIGMSIGLLMGCSANTSLLEEITLPTEEGTLSQDEIDAKADRFLPVLEEFELDLDTFSWNVEYALPEELLIIGRSEKEGIKLSLYEDSVTVLWSGTSTEMHNTDDVRHLLSLKGLDVNEEDIQTLHNVFHSHNKSGSVSLNNEPFTFVRSHFGTGDALTFTNEKGKEIEFKFGQEMDENSTIGTLDEYYYKLDFPVDLSKSNNRK